MNYIFLNYLPGSAGNFFTRCLNLLDNFYCFGNKATDKFPETLSEKIKLLNYTDVMNFNPLDSSWTDWEREVAMPWEITAGQNTFELPNNSYIIFSLHPDNKHGPSHDIVRSIDRKFVLYIDPEDKFEWVLLNAIFKQSFQSVDWYKNGKTLLDDNSVHKISLTNIITSKHTLLTEIEKICIIFEHKVSANELTAIGNLYDQWQTTIIPLDNLEEFKRQLGWNT